MFLSRFPRAVRFGVALFDYAVVVVLAAVVSTWWLVIRLEFDPDMTRVGPGYEGLVVAAMVASVLFFISVARRHPWFAASRKRLVWSVAALLGLGGVAWMQVRAFVLTAGESRGDDTTHLLIVQCGVFLLVLVGLFFLRRLAIKQGWVSIRGRAVIAAALAVYLVYLVRDEPVAPSVERNRAVMAGRCEDESSYRLTLRYTPGVGGGMKFAAPSRTLDFGKQGEKRRAYLLAHRDELEANWAELAEVRAWWAEMAALPRIGDRSEHGFDQPVIRFQPVRAYMQHALAIASLRAIDGDGDAALAIVGEVYVVGARLEPASRTLLRSMVARVVQKGALETAEFVCDTATVSAEARTRFAGLLAGPEGGGLGARRLVLTDAASFFLSGEGIATFARLSGSRSGESWAGYIGRSVTAFILSVTLNPQATANRANDWVEEIALLAEAHKEDEIRKREMEMPREWVGHFQVKNISGRLLLPTMTPVYSGIVKNYWEGEGRRVALLKRLGDAPAAP